MARPRMPDMRFAAECRIVVNAMCVRDRAPDLNRSCIESNVDEVRLIESHDEQAVSAAVEFCASHRVALSKRRRQRLAGVARPDLHDAFIAICNHTSAVFAERPAEDRSEMFQRRRAWCTGPCIPELCS